MPPVIPPEVLQAQANLAAPGVPMQTQQDAAPEVAKTRKQPAAPKKKTGAQKVYPKLAAQGGEGA